MSNPRKRDFALTGNYVDEDERDELALVLKRLVDTRIATYACFGEEVAPTTGHLHLQAYIRFKDCKTKSAARKLLPGFHVTLCNGSAEDNIKYCSKTRKEDDVPNEVFVQYGTAPSVLGEDGGQRTKELWNEYKASAKEGRLDDIDGEIFIKHYSSLKRIERDFMAKPMDLDTTCGIWFYGDTGTGKSHAARAEFPDYFLKRPNKWFDGYQGQENVIVDDLDKSHKFLGFDLKIWADKYAFPAEVKGSSIQIRPKRIIVTSNYHPRDIFADDAQILDPILRRFRVTKFGGLAVDPVEDQEERRDGYAAVPGYVPEVQDSIVDERGIDGTGLSSQGPVPESQLSIVDMVPETPPYSPPGPQDFLAFLSEVNGRE